MSVALVEPDLKEHKFVYTFSDLITLNLRSVRLHLFGELS
jgi:hypothetical protein